MKRAGVPILPGSEGILASDGEAIEWARQVGYPVIVKASAGGGGRGMRIVRSEEELPALFTQAQAEAAGAFGNGDLYMEKYVERPRHIEFQILADQHGKVVSLGERECSIQRRHQKLLEESPSTQVTPELRDQIGAILCKALTDIGYMNAGTIEFLMDQDRRLHFIEMNTRIQVEHPVTEMVTGLDLVATQLALAAGRSLADLGLRQEEIPPPRGVAIEVRVNMETLAADGTVRPSAGVIDAFEVPTGPGVRVDTSGYAGYRPNPSFDPLLAKVVARIGAAPFPQVGSGALDHDTRDMPLPIFGFECGAALEKNRKRHAMELRLAEDVARHALVGQQLFIANRHKCRVD